MNNYYEVRFDTYKNGVAKVYAVHVEAPNKKEAKRMVEKMWYVQEKDSRHMFHMTVERLPDTAEVLWHWFHVSERRTYKGNLTPRMNCPSPDYYAIVGAVETEWYDYNGEEHMSLSVSYRNGREDTYIDWDVLPLWVARFLTSDSGSCSTTYNGTTKTTNYTA